ncbi:MAG: GNAT family N-acetyltransferase [Polyangiaceae bacterium]
MRREQFRASSEDALALFERAHHVHLAAVLPNGAPLYRALHGVVVRGHLAFHAAPIGEKLEVAERAVVMSAFEPVAQIPSWFLDPERACPATTLYRSAQAHGVLREIEEPAFRAEVLARLMAKFQPEGGYTPIEAESPLYKKAIAGLFLGAIPLDRVDGKDKLMQNRSARDRARVIECLWRRGAHGDVAAIEAIRAACPADPTPSWLAFERGIELRVALRPGDAEAAAALLADAYWNDRFSPGELARAARGSAWVGAVDAEGRLCATARAISDGAKHAWIYDVFVAEAARGTGLGERLMRLLLDHPEVRGARFAHLGTRDAQAFYAKLGFSPASEIARPYSSTVMVRDRDGVPAAG